MKEGSVRGFDDTTAIKGSFMFVLGAEHLQGTRWCSHLRR